MAPFLWIVFSCLKATKSLRGDSLLIIFKYPRDPGTHLMELGRMIDRLSRHGTI